MIELDEDAVRKARALLTQLLALLPDPDAMVHARTFVGAASALCRRGGRAPRLTDEPRNVTCKSCRLMSDWEPWQYRRST